MRHSLTYKIITMTCLVVLSTMLLYAYLNIREVKKLLLRDTVNSAERLSETLVRATNRQMMLNHRNEAYLIMNEASRQEDVEAIRFINRSGRIVFSSNPAEIGTVLDRRSGICISCHDGNSPHTEVASMDRSRIFSNEAGKSVLGLSKAIFNDKGCATADCHVHSSGTRFLGLLDVVVSLEAMQDQLTRSRTWIIFLTMALLLLISFLLSIFTQRLVNRPINELLQHTQKVAGGNLETTLSPLSNDELGELTSSFNRMTLSLKTAHDELADWNRTLEERVEERTRENRQMQAQLARSERLSSLGQMATGIAHEINNPMTGILLYANLICDDHRFPIELHDDIAIIIRETERCGTIVRQLLDFSRENKPENCWNSLNSIVESALSLLEHQTTFQNITIERHFDRDLPDIFSDPWQLEQVFINIILNASQAISDAGSIRITTGLNRESMSVFADVTDSGCGIPQDELDRIFDPFFSTKEEGGTGLGLSVSYGIIHNHGGEIRVASECGTGTTVSITLPVSYNT